MLKKLCVVPLLLAGCVATAPSEPVQVTTRAQFLQIVEGKFLASSTATALVSADNTLEAYISSLDRTITGTWNWTNGKFCRTLSAGSGVADSECQNVVSNGDTVTLAGPASTVIYKIR